MADKTTNQAMNDFIRGIHRPQPTVAAQPAPAPYVPGNAGAGCGSPPPTPVQRSMNEWLRAAYQSGFTNYTFRT